MIREINLIAKDINNIQQIGGKDTQYKFQGKPYLRATVRKTGIYLSALTYFKGNPIKKSFGRYGEISLKEFIHLGDAFLARVKNHRHPSLLNVTLDQFFYEVHLPSAKRETVTWKQTESRYRSYIRSGLGHMKIDEIRSYDIERVLAVATEGLSNSSYNKVRAILHRSFTIAVQVELLDRNPCSSVPQKKEHNVVERILTPDEQPHFVKACLDNPNSLPHQCVLLCLLTGGRVGNVISIEKQHIAPDLSQLTFPRTKSGKAQVLPLSTPARRVIQQVLSLSSDGEPYLFPSSRTQTGHIAYPRSAFQDICKTAGIAVNGSDHPITEGFPKEPLTIHCLRKSFASSVLEHTKDIYCASTLLNHSSVEVTKRYAFHQQSALSKAVEGAGALLTHDVPNFPKTETV